MHHKGKSVYIVIYHLFRDSSSVHSLKRVSGKCDHCCEQVLPFCGFLAQSKAVLSWST